MKNIYYSLCIITLLSGSCRQEEVPEKATLYPVSFSLPAIEAMTRASEGATDLANGATLTIAAYDPTTEVLVTQCNYTVSSGSLAADPAGSKMYLAAGTYDFCAISPAQTLASDGKTATIEKDVDILGSVTRALMGPEDTNIELNDLSHLASQLRFTFRMVKNNTDLEEFKVQKVTISDMVTSFADNLLLPANTLSIPQASETVKYESLEIINSDDVPTFDYSTTAPSGYTTGSHYNIQKEPMQVFPRADESFKVTVEISEKRTNDASASVKKYSATISRVAFDPGKQYHFMVNFGWDFMDFTVTVSDWVAKDNGQGAVGSGEQEINSTFVVDEWATPVELGGDLGVN